MSIQIEGIGNQKISYKDHKTINFYSLPEYLNLAKKSISKFANKFYGGLARKMLKDEDAVSNIAYSLMLADWRYDENYQSQNSQKKTQYSYRNQCALWAIQSYITKNYKTKKSSPSKIFSLDHYSNDESNNSYRFIQDQKAVDPHEYTVSTEEQVVIKDLITKLLSTKSISDRQKQYIELYYYEGMTFDQIGKKFSLTREAVRQSIKKAIAKIKEENINECIY